MIIITNNDKVMIELETLCEKEFIQGTFKDVLINVRDRIHRGHKLLTHPLSGSVKPNETPFKSIIITKNKDVLDIDSLEVIENSIKIYENFMKNQTRFGDTKKIQYSDDLKLIDFELLSGALRSIR